MGRSEFLLSHFRILRADEASLAIMELRLTLVWVLWHFDVRSADGAAQWDPEGELKHLRSYMVWDKPPLMARVYPVAI